MKKIYGCRKKSDDELLHDFMCFSFIFLFLIISILAFDLKANGYGLSVLGGGTSQSSGGGGSITLPSCGVGEVVFSDGVSLSCVSDTVDGVTCMIDQVLVHDGVSWVCVDKDLLLPICTTGQVLRHNGTDFVCVNEFEMMACAVDEILIHDGTAWQCQPKLATLPACLADEFLLHDGVSWTCQNKDEALIACADGQQLIYDFSSSTWVCSDDLLVALGCGAGDMLINDGINWGCYSGFSVVAQSCSSGSSMIYDGTSWQCEAVPTCSAGQLLTYSAGNYSCVNACLEVGGNVDCNMIGDTYYSNGDVDLACATCGIKNTSTANSGRVMMEDPQGYKFEGDIIMKSGLWGSMLDTNNGGFLRNSGAFPWGMVPVDDPDGLLVNGGGISWSGFIYANFESPLSTIGGNGLYINNHTRIGGRVLASDLGTGNPTYTFTNDGDTGIAQWATGDVVRIVTGGETGVFVDGTTNRVRSIDHYDLGDATDYFGQLTMGGNILFLNLSPRKIMTQTGSNLPVHISPNQIDKLSVDIYDVQIHGSNPNLTNSPCASATDVGRMQMYERVSTGQVSLCVCEQSSPGTYVLNPVSATGSCLFP